MSDPYAKVLVVRKKDTMNNGYSLDEQWDTADNTCPDCYQSYSQCDC
jgi:hypothetical protein